MTLPFTNQVALVTGAGIGIGFEIARELALKGAAVLLNDIDESVAQAAAATIVESGGRCTAIAGDAADIIFIEQMVAMAVKEYGHLSMLVANAGITLFDDFFNYQPAALQKVMNLNLSGSFFLAQAAAKQMKIQQTGGSILFMSSVTGHQAHQHLAAYGMTKAGLEMLARSLVIELSPHQININAIAPGATETERTSEDPEYHATWSKITPMGRPAKVSDISNAALFLLSPASKHITGQTLVVDGGWTCVSPSPY
ncbi:MAG: SDR family oxidoreductase [Sphingobacteriia bacterium]|nr:MAG: SDR family oxidoreductase [Sphingobacteriia bacterium]